MDGSFRWLAKYVFHAVVLVWSSIASFAVAEGEEYLGAFDEALAAEEEGAYVDPPVVHPRVFEAFGNVDPRRVAGRNGHGNDSQPMIDVVIILRPEGDSARKIPSVTADSAENRIGQKELRRLQDDFRAVFDGREGFEFKMAFSFEPAVSVRLSRSLLDEVVRHPGVAQIDVDKLMSLQTQTMPEPLDLEVSESARFGEAVGLFSEAMGGVGLAGNGQTIIIIDTGYTDRGRGNVVAEHCMLGEHCPEGVDVAIDEHGHGSKMYGVADSMAPDAEYIIYKIAGSSGVISMSNVVSALDHAYVHYSDKNPVFSLSLGTRVLYSDLSSCELDNPIFGRTIRRVSLAGGVIVAASGNDASMDGKGFPACMGEYVVSALAGYDVYEPIRLPYRDDDGNVLCVDEHPDVMDVVCSSNRPPLFENDVLVPASYTRTIDMSGAPVNALGTSVAAATLASWFALKKQVYPEVTLEELLASSRETGVPIDDSASGSVFPFLDARADIERTIELSRTPSPDIIVNGQRGGHMEASLGDMMAVDIDLRGTFDPAGFEAELKARLGGMEYYYNGRGWSLTPVVVEISDVNHFKSHNAITTNALPAGDYYLAFTVRHHTSDSTGEGWIGQFHLTIADQ